MKYSANVAKKSNRWRFPPLVISADLAAISSCAKRAVGMQCMTKVGKNYIRLPSQVLAIFTTFLDATFFSRKQIGFQPMTSQGKKSTHAQYEVTQQYSDDT